MRRFTIALLAALTLSTALSAAPAQAHDRTPPLGLANCTATACHFDVPPGTYDVTVRLGGTAAASTAISGETRRSLLPETATAADHTVTRAFTVDVRTPKANPPAPTAPRPRPHPRRHRPRARRYPRHTRAPRPPDHPHRRLHGMRPAGRPVLGLGSTTATVPPEGRLGRQLRGFRESTVTYLENPLLWATVEPLIRPGDLVLVQLAHNDKTTDEATYRANLETLVRGIRDRGGRPVLVTPIVRRWFNADGTLDNDTALLVNGLGVDLPGVIRSVAAAERVTLVDLTAQTKALAESLGVEGSKAIYLYNEKKDNTHTSAHGATVYAGLVRDALVARHLLPEDRVRVG